MPNPYFQFKHFIVFHDRCAMKVTTDACLFGAWCAEEIRNTKYERRNNQCEAGSDHLLDIGAGTGLLSLMIAQKTNFLIDAVEIDSNAAWQAKENIQASPWKEKISIYQDDILKFHERQYHIIVSNPPFYEREIKSANEKKNKAHHSQTLKLFELIAFIKRQLITGGNFYLLLPFKRKNEVEIILKKQGLFIQKQIIVSPSPLHLPFRVIIKGGHLPAIMEEKFLSINNQQEEYTREFVCLLQDYYLHL